MKIGRLFHLISILLLALTLGGCSLIKTSIGKAGIKKRLKSPIFSSQFTGVVLYDPETREYLFQRNEDLFFTPASNIKLLTAVACLESFPDSIPSFSYAKFNDTLYLEPMGDPTFLHADFPNQPIINQLKNSAIKLHLPEAQLSPFGPGWAWDDYHLDFQQQLAWMPIYGNEVRITPLVDSVSVVPKFFSDYVNVFEGSRPWDALNRELKYNIFNVWKNNLPVDGRIIPFDYSNELALALLNDTLPKSVELIDQLPYELYGTLYNQATLPVISLMMNRSDNFLAEQLLITAARSSGHYNPQAFRDRKIEDWGITGAKIQWVDGSGLSRYNLVTPEVMVHVLERLYTIKDWNTIKWILPTGGSSGTIKDWYKGETAYVFAKTGTLKNNHSLSGFIQTESGKTLIFSIMNNHYTSPVSEVKKEMESLLEWIRNRY